MRRQAAWDKRAKRLVTLDWRSTGAEQIVSLEAAAERLGLGFGTLRVYLSNGHAAKGLTRANPITGVLDIVTIEAQPLAELAKPRVITGRPRGRPKKWHPEMP